MSILHDLMRVIESRRSEANSKSYTATLLAGGVEKIAAKVSEEAAELIESARSDGDSEVVHEAADLLYHVLVLLASRNLSILDVESELKRRFGISGLEEKAGRHD